MSLQSLQPYVGNDEYITLISCPEDSAQAEKLIRKPLLEGYRIWFDNSDLSEPERIAQQEKIIDNTFVCMVLLSSVSVNSHSFRSGFTYAVNMGKPVVLIYADSTPLSIGMQIQAAYATGIEKYKLSSEEFFDRLFDIKPIRKCKDTQVEKAVTMWLERDSNKEIIILKTGATTFGRLAEMCDYVIENNKYIGRLHATIINSGKHCVIIDNDSKNKTYVNSRMLVPDEQFRLYDGDTVMIANEKFVYHQN